MTNEPQAASEYWLVDPPRAPGKVGVLTATLYQGGVPSRILSALLREDLLWLVEQHQQAARVTALEAALKCVRVRTFKLPGEEQERVEHWLGDLPFVNRAHFVDESSACPLCAALNNTATSPDREENNG